MRVDNGKLGRRTGKTLRYCAECETARDDFQCVRLTNTRYNANNALSCNAKGRWELVHIISKHIKSLNDANKNKNKEVVSGYHNYQMYNGYKSSLRDNPPKHPEFTRPDFVYTPDVKMCKVNSKEFTKAIEQGAQYLKENDVDKLFDLSDESEGISLVYLAPNSHTGDNEMEQIYKHAFGLSAAHFYMTCSGQACNYGAKYKPAYDEHTIDDVYTLPEPLQKKNGRYCCCRNSYEGAEREENYSESRSKRRQAVKQDIQELL